MKQIKVWKGEFGKDYTDRNVIDWRLLLPAFKEMLRGLQIENVLEVGCNRGHNLVALAEFLGHDSEVVGIDPNLYAIEKARASNNKIQVLLGHAYDLPFKNRCFDLVFTAGVLIHIPIAELPVAMAEIYRVSKRYILAIEYFAEEETVIPYRGHDELLWKRDFCKHYRTNFPDLKLLRDGFWGPEHGFDRTNWWLFEKTV
jgi:pseudaminic acid biosynthesis-associated methylase